MESRGGVPEWLIGAVSKTVVRLGVPWVRIPPPPPPQPAGPAGRLPPPITNFRRGARVDDWARLEIVCACKGTVGSNPTPSATSS